MRVIGIITAVFLLSGCGVHDYKRVIQIAQDPSSQAVRAFAADKAVTYAANPDALQNDVQQIKQNYEKLLAHLTAAAAGEWGEENVKTPGKKQYVKYTQNYKSRARIDFDRGVVIVETVDGQKPKQSLQKAITTTLLTPQDPRKVDLYSAKSVSQSGRPFLAGQVKDHDSKTVLYEWRANRFANYLVDTQMQQRTEKNKTIHYVNIKMEKNAPDQRAAKYKAYVDKYARQYGIDRALVYAIMKTESSFNPYAVSHIPAYGLMQIVPTTAGVDANEFIRGSKRPPSRDYLFDPANNIQMGTAYLHILYERYLDEVHHPLNQEYAVISAYNTGAGNVLRTFDPNRKKAFAKINRLRPPQLYDKLRRKLPYAETRRYLHKVTSAKKEFIIYEG
ncbi:MAG: murein transglycosylase domain-containing protein [Campylobacterota bacterium]